jgi:hypothetical protein
MFPTGVPDEHAYRYKRGGELAPVQNVGLPLLLAPAVPWVEEAEVLSPTRHLWPWNIEIILIAALAAQLLYRILLRLRPQHPRLAAGVWASVVFSPPMVVYASQIFPEMPAALLALVAVDALLKPPTRRSITIGAGALALMPWLHVRFLPISAVLAIGLAIRASAAPPAVQHGGAARARRAAWAIAPLLLSLVVMGIAFQHWYGSFLPNAQYRLPQTSQPQTLSASWTALTGAFWSSQDGWLPLAPVCILALATMGPFRSGRCGCLPAEPHDRGIQSRVLLCWSVHGRLDAIRRHPAADRGRGSGARPLAAVAAGRVHVVPHRGYRVRAAITGGRLAKCRRSNLPAAALALVREPLAADCSKRSPLLPGRWGRDRVERRTARGVRGRLLCGPSTCASGAPGWTLTLQRRPRRVG